MKVYGIGGLGTDERIFSELELNFELTPLRWITPKSGESLQNYAARFAMQIDQSVPFAIIGVSFGGIMAIELSKLMDPEKIVLISSASSKHDIPRIFRLMGKSGLLSLIPNSLIKPPMFLANYFFGVSEPKHKQALKQILADTDVHFLRWAIKEIAWWKHANPPTTKTIRIHGSQDRLLHCSKEQSVTLLPNAGHFMIVNRANDMSHLLNDVFQ